MKARPSPPPRARILGAGAVVTLEDPEQGTRSRVRVRSRENRVVRVEPLPGANVSLRWREGANLTLRAARPSGLFCYRATVEGATDEGWGVLRLEAAPPRRRQLRGYFRMAVRFGVLLEVSPEQRTAPMLRACNLSGSGILLHDPNRLLALRSQVRLGLPLGPAGEIVRLPARVIRTQDDPPRAALAFDEISETSRLLLLRYLFREHRKRRKRGHSSMGFLAPVTPIERP
jgi:c-di-GMP-binding flagellar brake protein YcgR